MEKFWFFYGIYYDYDSIIQINWVLKFSYNEKHSKMEKTNEMIDFKKSMRLSNAHVLKTKKDIEV